MRYLNSDFQLLYIIFAIVNANFVSFFIIWFRCILYFKSLLNIIFKYFAFIIGIIVILFNMIEVTVFCFAFWMKCISIYFNFSNCASYCSLYFSVFFSIHVNLLVFFSADNSFTLYIILFIKFNFNSFCFNIFNKFVL